MHKRHCELQARFLQCSICTYNARCAAVSDDYITCRIYIIICIRTSTRIPSVHDRTLRRCDLRSRTRQRHTTFSAEQFRSTPLHVSADSKQNIIARSAPCSCITVVCTAVRIQCTSLCHELLSKVLVDVLSLPVCNTNFLDDGTRGVLHEEVGWCTLCVRDFQILHTRRLGVDELLDGWVVTHASLAYVERRGRKLPTCPHGLFGAAAAALGNELVRWVDMFTELLARQVQRQRIQSVGEQVCTSGVIAHAPCRTRSTQGMVRNRGRGKQLHRAPRRRTRR